MPCDHKFIDSKRCVKCGWVAPESKRFELVKDACGCDESKALRLELEAMREAACSALGFLPRNDPGARMAAEKIERALSGGVAVKPWMTGNHSRCASSPGGILICELPAGHAGQHRCCQVVWP